MISTGFCERSFHDHDRKHVHGRGYGHNREREHGLDHKGR